MVEIKLDDVRIEMPMEIVNDVGHMTYIVIDKVCTGARISPEL
jgi:hypothetical protein